MSIFNENLYFSLFKSIQIANQTSQYTPIRIQDITKARNGINSIARVMLQIADHITDNEAILQKLLDKQNTDMIELEELKAKQQIKATVVYKIPKSNPAVVCNASSCVEIVKVRFSNMFFFMMFFIFFIIIS